MYNRKKTLPILILAISGTLVSFSFNAKQDKALQESMARGEELYLSNCVTCHMANGEGIKQVFPPLAASDYLIADNDRAIKQILYGAKGEMVVNGVTYNGEMSGFDLSDQQIADILNYIKNSWGNKAKITVPDQVKKARK